MATATTTVKCVSTHHEKDFIKELGIYQALDSVSLLELLKVRYE